MNKYLIFDTELAAKTRSAQEAVNLGFTNADTTKEWWAYRETSAGTWALEIPEAEVSRLSESEQSDLVDEVEWLVVEEI